MKKGVQHQKSEERIQTLVSIAQQHNGLLKAENVLEEAKHEDSPLHDSFEWDDSIAGQSFRLLQARFLIQAAVRYLPEGPREDVRVFVSLSSDRNYSAGGGGYRLLTDVISDEQLYKELLDDAMKEYITFRKKYETVKELQPLFKEGERILRQTQDT